MITRLYLVFLLAALGCQVNTEPGELANQNLEVAKNDPPHTEVWSKVKINTEKPELEDTDENLFGKFYNDRIEFHIIEEPDMNMHDAIVKRITLYYIDGVLCKKKYELDRAIADELAMTYGAVSYKSLNYSTDSLARAMGIVLPAASGRRFNPYLKKYQLKWSLDDKNLYFRHLEDTEEIQNLYVEELEGYKRLYRSVQKDLL